MYTVLYRLNRDKMLYRIHGDIRNQPILNFSCRLCVLIMGFLVDGLKFDEPETNVRSYETDQYDGFFKQSERGVCHAI